MKRNFVCFQEQLIQSRIKRSSCGSGVLCLPLPIRNPFGLEGDPVIELRAVQQIILRARLKQPALYLASLSELEYGILTKVRHCNYLLNFIYKTFYSQNSVYFVGFTFSNFTSDFQFAVQKVFSNFKRSGTVRDVRI